jgi:signal transduction histidine kinase
MATRSIQDSSAGRANGFRSQPGEAHRKNILDYLVSRRFRPETALSVVGSLAVGLIAFFSYQTHLNVATAGLLCVIVVVLLSRAGGFASSIVTCILAAACLAYLAPPTYSFRIDDSLDVLAIATFLIASLAISRLMSKLRKMLDEDRSKVSRRLVDAEEQERARIARELHDDIPNKMCKPSLIGDRRAAALC